MAEQDTSPDELQLKKRARRRLVGAAALALFAVIVLPMVMDREPRPLNQDIQVRIPSQDSTGFASKLLPGKPATPMPEPESKPVVEEKPAAQAKVEPAPAAAAKPSVPASAEPVAKPAEKPAAQEKKAELAEKPAVQDKKAASAEKPAVQEKKVASAEKPAVQEKKPAATEKPSAQGKTTGATEKPAAGDVADAAGQWVIQLGAYREAGKVKNLLSKLKGINVPAYTEKVETPQGPLTRVRAGPFASQEAAEKARGRVKIIGVDGPVAPK